MIIEAAITATIIYVIFITVRKVLKKCIDSTCRPHAHRCFSGTQIWCTYECTIAADPDVREVFHKCINGGIKRLGVDTAVFYPITDSIFYDTKTIDEVVGERLFAALGITTPEGKQ
ncbi:MAG: hypothetical protein KAJ03_04355 [Gammaproteobacteria bacterium]|nr:hypothetical protein [Gammaproteobacteria bacterium]